MKAKRKRKSATVIGYVTMWQSPPRTHLPKNKGLKMIKMTNKNMKQWSLPYFNLPVHTRNTAVWVHGVPRCAKIEYRTRTRVTRFGNTTGITIPVWNPNYDTEWMRNVLHMDYRHHTISTAPIPNTPILTNSLDMMYDSTQAQKWHICQNYGALNWVTQVFPMPQGDICTKQCRLSGHWWIHGFDFASGFYTVTIPEELQPYLA